MPVCGGWVVRASPIGAVGFLGLRAYRAVCAASVGVARAGPSCVFRGVSVHSRRRLRGAGPCPVQTVHFLLFAGTFPDPCFLASSRNRIGCRPHVDGRRRLRSPVVSCRGHPRPIVRLHAERVFFPLAVIDDCALRASVALSRFGLDVVGLRRGGDLDLASRRCEMIGIARAPGAGCGLSSIAWPHGLRSRWRRGASPRGSVHCRRLRLRVWPRARSWRSAGHSSARRLEVSARCRWRARVPRRV